MKSFGELLKEYRQRRKLTQQDFADRLGLSSPYIAQMESGFKPPPPPILVDKMSSILHVSGEDKRGFLEAAEKEREVQSLTKATRKIGYLLAGNKVCVPQKAVSYRTQQEIDELANAIPRHLNFSIDVPALSTRKGTHQTLMNSDDIRSYGLAELGEQPSHWLSFLGQMYDILLMTPDERILCRQPSARRKKLLETTHDAGKFFQIFKSTIDEACRLADEQKLPDVIAPHEAWQNIDETLGPPPPKEVETVSKKVENGEIREIPIVSSIPAGSDEFDERTDLGFIGLPKNWFNSESDYEACFVQTDAYVSLGVWPGCKAIYEVDSSLENEDLVVVQLGDRRCLRKYFDMGTQILLQGGPLSRPIRVNKGEGSVQVIGVVKELVSRFKELRS